MVATSPNGDEPDVGLWASTTRAGARRKAAALCQGGSWLREAGYRARVLGRYRRAYG